jgi:hypothetical protein
LWPKCKHLFFFFWEFFKSFFLIKFFFLLIFFFFNFFYFYLLLLFSSSKLFSSNIDPFFSIFLFFYRHHFYHWTWIFYAQHLGIAQTIPKISIGILCFKCGYCKIILIKLMFIVTLIQVFHIKFNVSEVLLMQHCSMFQTHIFRENFNKILMQCSHSRHANIIQMWSYNCNKKKLVYIDANITYIKTF